MCKYVSVCIQYNVNNCGNVFHELETDDKNTKHTLIEGVNEGERKESSKRNVVSTVCEGCSYLEESSHSNRQQNEREGGR